MKLCTIFFYFTLIYIQLELDFIVNILPDPNPADLFMDPNPAEFVTSRILVTFQIQIQKKRDPDKNSSSFSIRIQIEQLSSRIWIQPGSDPVRSALWAICYCTAGYALSQVFHRIQSEIYLVNPNWQSDRLASQERLSVSINSLVTALRSNRVIRLPGFG
jgi:hypothetical protein